MISIVVCCRKESDCLMLETSVRKTIGVPFEMIAVLDDAHDHSIFKALNHGIKQARFENICLTHDDVRFHTENWGLKILDHLKNDGTGLIGIAGTPTLGNIPSDWSFDIQYKYLLQKNKHHKNAVLEMAGNFSKEHALQAVTLDGVFLCCKKSLFQTLSFDENSFTGFHTYDIDLCLQAHFSGYENKVINDVLIEHLSMGKKNRVWVENQLALWRKWSKHLPTSLLPIESNQLLEKERCYMEYHFAQRMVKCGFSFDEIRKVLSEYQLLRKNKTRFRTLHLLLAKTSFLFKRMFIETTFSTVL